MFVKSFNLIIIFQTVIESHSYNVRFFQSCYLDRESEAVVFDFFDLEFLF